MTYLITNDNRVHRMPADGPEPANTALVFCTADELMAGTTPWPLARLALVWNKLPGTKAVARFENRRIAVDRLWRAVQNIGGQLAGKATRSRKQSTGARQNRAELIIGMLREPNGATLHELMAATAWQAHSVRGFLSRKVSRDLGLPVRSFRRDGERVYALTLPDASRSEL